MAVRKAKTTSRSARGGSGSKKSSPGKGKEKSSSWAVLFWLAFAIFIFGLFIFNREAISGSIQAIQKEFASKKSPKDETPSPPLTATPVTIETPAPPAASTPAAAEPPVQTPPASHPAIEPKAGAAAPAQTTPVQTAVPAAQPAHSVERRERALYFTQVDRDGTILRVKVNRNLQVSASPMTDVIQALITGPTGEERNRGLISFIPPNTQILSAAIRTDTAYISFSEEFQYNTYGVEGYAGQVRQIVFTVTEFPNVKNVQILIEGRRIDFLGEGVWIGSPLNREMF